MIKSLVMECLFCVPASLVAHTAKNPPAMRETWVQFGHSVVSNSLGTNGLLYTEKERERERERDAPWLSIRIRCSQHHGQGSISHQWSLSSRASLVASHLRCRRPCFGSLGWKDPLEKEKVTHSYILVWEIPWRKESVRLYSMGSQKSQTQLSD